MKTPGARIIAGVLIVSLLCLPAGLSAKERWGYDLIVTRLNGSHALGELLAVRPESLLLLAGMKELAVSRSDIMSVRIVSPSELDDRQKDRQGEEKEEPAVAASQ